MVFHSVLTKVKDALRKGTEEGQNTADVDVLLIGGGVQGLTLLRELTDRGYGVALVTNSPVGSGQSLHWHGVLASGYTSPRPTVRTSVVEDWLPHLDELDVSTYGGDDWYVLATAKPYQKLTDAWEKHGYPYEEPGVAELPAAYRRGGLFEEGGESHVLSIDERCVEKQALVESLVSGHEQRVVVGDVTDYEFSQEGNQPAVAAVEVDTRDNDRVEFSPEYVVAAAGTGTHGLFESMIATDGFTAAGGSPSQVRDDLTDVTYRNVHMLTIRGPAAELPAVSAYVPPKKMKAVSHRHERNGEDYVTCYITNKPLSQVDPAESPDDGRGDVDAAHVAEGFNKFFDLAPGIRDTASQPDSSIEFCAYAGVKQFIRDQPNVPYAESVSGIQNVGVALPSVMAAVHLSTEKMVDQITDEVTPSGTDAPVPGAGNPPIGRVTERHDDIEWLDWNDLTDAYPGIKSRPTQ